MRLIDVHVDWALQYASETTLFDASLYPRVSERIGQVEGYLDATWAAVLACFRRGADWERQADPWSALSSLIVRLEAEFAGRLLMGPADWARWQDDVAGLTWGVIGVEGFDALLRTTEDLDHLPVLFERGVRLFQPIYTSSSQMGGSAMAGDDRGLTELGEACLQTLDAVAQSSRGPRALIDLAHMNPVTAAGVLAWFERDGARANRLVPVYSHGALHHDGFPLPRALTATNLARLRALGGFVGLSVTPPFYDAPETLKAAIETIAAVPFQGTAGYEGIAIGTDFLGVDETMHGLRTAPEVIAWLSATFPEKVASALTQGNGVALVARMVGIESASMDSIR
jgi:membrane dipeptidase